MADALVAARVPRVTPVVGPRVLFISAPAVGVAFVAGVAARMLMAMIAFVTNAAFLQRVSLQPAAPHQHHLGLLVIFVPALGGIVVGFMARYGSKAIRGHGIPEAMEQVLTNESRIPPRLTFLKPLSAAIAIGTGGPFGAEGPIIATGGALGSLVGQVLKTTSAERKTLLAAGAAAGMAATFGSPPPAVAFEGSSLREAADLMVTAGIGRLPVVTQAEPGKVIGILTRSDLLSAHARRLNENDHIAPSRLPLNRKRQRKAG